MGELSAETLDAAAAAGVVLVPTLSIVAAMAENPPADRSDRIRGRLDLTAAAFARALASGVRIACGTDIGCYPHARGSLSELRLMVEMGMSPLAALCAATREAADLLDLPDRGRIAAGAAADLCAFAGDDLGAALTGGRPAIVIQAGKIVRGSLDRPAQR
jgi:imidazolonepropionase-like amidohydrolase